MDAATTRISAFVRVKISVMCCSVSIGLTGLAMPTAWAPNSAA
jgi:hypothetical protein